MRLGKTLVGLTGGALVALFVGTLVTPEDAHARNRRRRKGGPMRLVDVNVGTFAGLPLNSIIEIKFTQPVDIATVNAAVVRIRQQNETGTGFTKQVPGSFQIRKNLVRFFPRLATHLRDPDKTDGSFYPEGHVRDDALENSGLQPDTNYEIEIVGHPDPSPIRSTKGRRLSKSETFDFATAPISPRDFAFTIDTYQDTPPPVVDFTNPVDKVASVIDQYANHGGTRGVPSNIVVTLFGNRIPLSPSTLRSGQNSEFLLTERKGDASFRKPVLSSAFVEQNFDSTIIVFDPDFPLADQATYAIRVTKNVKDISERFDSASNAERLRLREIWEFLDTARQLSPGTPFEQLPNPPISTIFDWPVDAIARGVLKRNALELGDTYPDEIDPRIHLIFSTRDEDVSEGTLSFEFEDTDGRYDATISTASYDGTVPGAAAAIMTIAGGSGADGDYLPGTSESINTDAFPGNTVNWRRVFIPPGVVVNFTGSRPATIRALEIQIEGEMRADGLPGQNGGTGGGSANWTSTANTRVRIGGAGGPGGGKGGNTSNLFPDGTQVEKGVGLTGTVGIDANGVLADVDDGGRGGLGGRVAKGTTAYIMAGSGGGGGARLAGSPGSRGSSTGSITSWRGAGGAGGAGSSNEDLNPLVGGAGGGAGGNGSYVPSGWRIAGGSGGGGGGAISVQTASILKIGSQGLLQARGGTGGQSSGRSQTFSGGSGGGGGGGSVLLRSSQGFDIASPLAATNVTGGAGGSKANNYGPNVGGVGGLGYVRVEDPLAAFSLPNATSGTFDPVGGGVQSVLYTKFVNLGVDEARLLNFEPEDFNIDGQNDAVLVEIQFAIEDQANLGFAKLDALQGDHSSANFDELTDFLPARILDNTEDPLSAIPLDGYVKGAQGPDVIFDIAGEVTGRPFKFVRLRITFQLDDGHTSTDLMPSVDRVDVNFQFNF